MTLYSPQKTKILLLEQDFKKIFYAVN